MQQPMMTNPTMQQAAMQTAANPKTNHVWIILIVSILVIAFIGLIFWFLEDYMDRYDSYLSSLQYY